MSLLRKQRKPKPSKSVIKGGKKIYKTPKQTLDLRNHEPAAQYQKTPKQNMAETREKTNLFVKWLTSCINFIFTALLIVIVTAWNIFAKTMDMIIEILIFSGSFVFGSISSGLRYGASFLGGVFTSVSIPSLPTLEKPKFYKPKFLISKDNAQREHTAKGRLNEEPPVEVVDPTVEIEETTDQQRKTSKEMWLEMSRLINDRRSFRLEKTKTNIFALLAGFFLGVWTYVQTNAGILARRVGVTIEDIARNLSNFTASRKETTIELTKDSVGQPHQQETPHDPQTRSGLFHEIMAHTKKHIKKQRSTWIGRFIHRVIILGVVTLFLVTGVFFIWVATLEIPELGNFAERDIRQSTKIYDKTGTVLLYDVFRDERRTVVDIDEVSDNVKLAILATEDDQFYNHNGVRPTALLRSIIQKIKEPNSRLAGGSTITQQVIKNSILTNERRIERKVKEWVLAWRLERQLSKDEILEAYLNEIAFGGSVYGVEQAARSFYNKPARELSIAESAYIAAIPKAPTFYSPFGQNRDRLEGRKDYILGRMLELSYITPDQFKRAKAEEVEFFVREDRGIKAPHFVFYVIEQLEEEYGAEVIERDGLRVITTLDWDLQQEFEAETAEYAEQLPQYQAQNLASVATEVQTGKIRAMVGSKDYFAEDIDGKFNIATAFRQPGSTFKPFVYALAFEKGYTPETMLWDVRTEFSSSCFADGTPKPGVGPDACYRPQNYDQRVRGPIAMGAALAQSLNIPAVKALYLVGVGDAIRYAKDLGISGLNRSASFYGLSLVLGGGEVRLIDMVSAYATFGNDGVKIEKTAIESVTSALGETLFESEQEQERVTEIQTARTVNAVLANDNLKRPVFGSRSVLYHADADVAVKTGTTNDFKDLWTVGYTPSIAVGVWIGNNNNTPMAQRPSSTVAAPYWRALMDRARELYPSGRFSAPAPDNLTGLPAVLNGSWQGNSVAIIDTSTGLPADENTPEEFLSFQNRPEYHSILHWVSKRDPRSGGSSQSDSIYENWEVAVRQYALAAGFAQPVLDDETSSSTDPDSGEENNAEEDPFESETIIEGTSDAQTVEVSIVSPAADAVLEADSRHEIQVQVSGATNRVERIFYYVNNSYLGSEGNIQTPASFVPSSIRGIANTNTIKVIVQLEDGSRIQRQTQFSVQ